MKETTNMKNDLYNKYDSIAINQSSKLFTCLLVVLPILHQYRLLPIEFVDLFSIIFFPSAIKNLLNGKNNQSFLAFYVYCASSVILSGLLYGNASFLSIIISSVRLIVIFTTIFSYSNVKFNYKYGADLFKRMMLLLSIVVILQYIIYIVFHIPTFLLIPNVTLNYGGGMGSSYLIQSLRTSVNGGYIYRPSSIFIEPSFFSYLSIPALVISLFDAKNENKKTKKYIVAIILTLASIITTSTVALICCIAVWILYLYQVEKNNRGKVTGRFFIIIVIAIIMTIVILRVDSVQYSLNRKIVQIQNMESGDQSSTSLRLLRGFLYFNEMDLIAKIIGCGFGKLTDYYIIHDIVLSTDKSLNNLSYMNSIFTILCSEGLIGFILYMSSFKKYLISKNYVTRILAIVLFLIMFGASVIDSAPYYLWMVFILCSADNCVNDE